MANSDFKTISTWHNISWKRFNEIANIMQKCGVGFDEVHGWFYGNQEKEGFIPHLFDKFLKLNKYCPFCDSTGMQSKSSLYPLNSKVCPYKEIEWSEEEG